MKSGIILLVYCTLAAPLFAQMPAAKGLLVCEVHFSQNIR